MRLENVQPGDTLIHLTNYNRIRRIVTVDRVTKTQVVVGHFKFRKLDGGRIGSDRWDSSQVAVPKPNELEEVRTLQLQGKLIGKINDGCQINLLRKMDLGKLRSIYQAMRS